MPPARTSTRRFGATSPISGRGWRRSRIRRRRSSYEVLFVEYRAVRIADRFNQLGSVEIERDIPVCAVLFLRAFDISIRRVEDEAGGNEIPRGVPSPGRAVLVLLARKMRQRVTKMGIAAV